MSAAANIGVMELIEKIVSDDNVVKALEYIEKNKKDTSLGIDGKKVPELREHLREIWGELKHSILNGTYKPQPVKRTEISKYGGGVRLLGIPTVLDRFIQQAMLQVLDWRFDQDFSIYSHGFRRGHSQKLAIEDAREHI
jgi:retron-type reverse transcriptase